jgi:hypothetical protein
MRFMQPPLGGLTINIQFVYPANANGLDPFYVAEPCIIEC